MVHHGLLLLRETHRPEFMHIVSCGCHLTLSISPTSLKTRYKEAAKLDSVNFTVSYSANTKFPSQPVDSRCSLTLDYHTRPGKFLKKRKTEKERQKEKNVWHLLLPPISSRAGLDPAAMPLGHSHLPLQSHVPAVPVTAAHNPRISSIAHLQFLLGGQAGCSAGSEIGAR